MQDRSPRAEWSFTYPVLNAFQWNKRLDETRANLQSAKEFYYGLKIHRHLHTMLVLHTDVAPPSIPPSFLPNLIVSVHQACDDGRLPNHCEAIARSGRYFCCAPILRQLVASFTGV